MKINKFSMKQMMGIFLMGMLLMVTTGYDYNAPRKDREYYEQRGEVVWEVPMDVKLIAFTFDDGPNAKTTPQILDILKQYDAKATFFVVGNRIDANQNILKRQIEEGHEVANHTYNHLFFDKAYPLEKINKEIESTKNKLLEVTQQFTPWFRPPGGIINDDVIKVAQSQGYTVVLWSWHQDTRDWASPGVGYIVNKVLNNARNGDIVLMHDSIYGKNQTAESLKQILPVLKEKGFTFVTVSELMKYKQANKVNQ